MQLQVITDPADVRALALAAVALDPVANTTFAAVAAAAERAEAAPWAARVDGAPGVLAARALPHSPVHVSAGWSDPTGLAAALAAADPPIVAVTAAVELVDAVVAELGRAVTMRMAERLFRLDELIEPAGTTGSARAATAPDLDLLAGWYEAFGVETFGRAVPDARAMIERELPQSRCWLWTVDGAPVSFAVRHPAQHGVARVGPVYTPPELRGRGYGSAATAAATRDILGAGDTPCLFTDLANPTSNGIYRALGYVPVLDRVLVRFD